MALPDDIVPTQPAPAPALPAPLPSAPQFVAEEAGPTPRGKQKVPDLYPGLTTLPLSDRMRTSLSRGGLNVAGDEKLFAQAHKSGDFATKAQILNKYGAYSDQITGTNNARNFLDTHRVKFDDERTAYGSTGGWQAFRDGVRNKLIEIPVGIGKLALAAHGLMTDDDKGWKDRDASLEGFFDQFKGYISEDYNQALASYSEKDGVRWNVNQKSLINTGSMLMGYLLPGLAIAKGASLVGRGAGLIGNLALDATMAEEGAATIGAAARVAALGNKVKVYTGLSSFLQMYPDYQREAMQNGLNIRDATTVALPLAALNAVIETANVGSLNKAFGLGERESARLVRDIADSEFSAAIPGLARRISGAIPDAAGSILGREVFTEFGTGVVNGTLRQLANTAEVKGLARLYQGIGAGVKRAGRGFADQGLTEGAEEVFQSLAENASKDIYNNLKSPDQSGKFREGTFGNYVFDALYGGALGAITGGAIGTVFQARQVSPTMYGFIASDMRTQAAKGVSYEQMLGQPDANGQAQAPTLKAYGLIQALNTKGDITDDQAKAITGQVQRMAESHRDFGDMTNMGDLDRHTMYQVAGIRDMVARRQAMLDDTVGQVQALDQVIADPAKAGSEATKAQYQREVMIRQLGPVDANTGLYQSQADLAGYATEVGALTSDIVGAYAARRGEVQGPQQPARIIRKRFEDGLAEVTSKFNIPLDFDLDGGPDGFVPAGRFVDPDTGQTILTSADNSRLRTVESTPVTQESPPLLAGDNGDEYIPGTYTQGADTVGPMLPNAEDHVRLATALQDPSNSLNADPYLPPDNSPEANLLRDGSVILTTLEQYDPNDGPDSLLNAEELAKAYLKATSGLAANPSYQAEYNTIAKQINDKLSKGNATATSPPTPVATSPLPTPVTPTISQSVRDQARQDIADQRSAAQTKAQNDAGLLVSQAAEKVQKLTEIVARKEKLVQVAEKKFDNLPPESTTEEVTAANVNLEQAQLKLKGALDQLVRATDAQQAAIEAYDSLVTASVEETQATVITEPEAAEPVVQPEPAAPLADNTTAAVAPVNSEYPGIDTEAVLRAGLPLVAPIRPGSFTHIMSAALVDGKAQLREGAIPTKNDNALLVQTSTGYQAWAVDAQSSASYLPRLLAYYGNYIRPVFNLYGGQINEQTSDLTFDSPSDIVTLAPAEIGPDGSLLKRGAVFVIDNGESYDDYLRKIYPASPQTAPTPAVLSPSQATQPEQAIVSVEETTPETQLTTLPDVPDTTRPAGLLSDSGLESPTEQQEYLRAGDERVAAEQQAATDAELADRLADSAILADEAGSDSELDTIATAALGELTEAIERGREDAGEDEPAVEPGEPVDEGNVAPAEVEVSGSPFVFDTPLDPEVGALAEKLSAVFGIPVVTNEGFYEKVRELAISRTPNAYSGDPQRCRLPQPPTCYQRNRTPRVW
jgi:hypothetical protein